MGEHAKKALETIRRWRKHPPTKRTSPLPWEGLPEETSSEARTLPQKPTLDQIALEELQKEKARQRNATEAPPADDGLFALDNRQADMGLWGVRQGLT